MSLQDLAILRRCRVCGEIYQAVTPSQKYCSQKCRVKVNNRRRRPDGSFQHGRIWILEDIKAKDGWRLEVRR